MGWGLGKSCHSLQVEKVYTTLFYENETEVGDSELHRLFNLPRIEKRKQTVTFASELSDGDITPLRGCLIDLSWYVILVSVFPGIGALLTIV